MSGQRPGRIRRPALRRAAFTVRIMITAAMLALLSGCAGWGFSGSGGGKNHLAAALGFALIESGWRVLFTRTTYLVQKLQAAPRSRS